MSTYIQKTAGNANGNGTFVKVITTGTGNAVEIPSSSRLSLNGSSSTAGVVSYGPGSMSYTAGGGSAHTFDQAVQLLAGRFVLPAGDTSATPGNATINSSSGKVAVASGANSVTVTCNQCGTASIVFAILQDATEADLHVRVVVPAAGSFTIYLSASTSAARKVGFIVFN